MSDLFRILEGDLDNVRAHDPAARSDVESTIVYSDLRAVWIHRFSHRLWERGGIFKGITRVLTQSSRWLIGIEIHPGAQIGRRFFIDHGMDTVVGKTAEIGDDCTLYRDVALGGRSLEKVKRHPTLEDDVTIGAGVKVLDSTTVGVGPSIGANSVVTHSCSSDSIVMGTPGRVHPVKPGEHKPLCDPMVYVQGDGDFI